MSRPYAHRKAIREAKRIEGGVCAVCQTTEELRGHHLFEFRLGGTAQHENIVVLCQRHHVLAHRGLLLIERVVG